MTLIRGSGILAVEDLAPPQQYQSYINLYSNNQSNTGKILRSHVLKYHCRRSHKIGLKNVNDACNRSAAILNILPADLVANKKYVLAGAITVKKLF